MVDLIGVDIPSHLGPSGPEPNLTTGVGQHLGKGGAPGTGTQDCHPVDAVVELLRVDAQAAATRADTRLAGHSPASETGFSIIEAFGADSNLGLR